MSWLTEPDSDWDSPDDPYSHDDEPRSRVRLIALALGGWLAVSLVVLVVLLSVTGRHSANHAAAPSTAAAGPSTAPSSRAAATGPVLPSGWVKEASDSQTDCAAHAYGQVQAFFASTPCTSVRRLLATTNERGRTVVIASNIVTFDSPAQARRYLGLVNSDGTGNISDLLREGVTYAGAPSKLPDAAFASRLAGSTVLVAEAGYTGGPSDASDPTLRAIAQQGVA